MPACRLPRSCTLTEQLLGPSSVAHLLVLLEHLGELVLGHALNFTIADVRLQGCILKKARGLRQDAVVLHQNRLGFDISFLQILGA